MTNSDLIQIVVIDKLPPLVIFEPKEFIVRTFRTETVPKTAD